VYCDEVWTGIEYQVAAHLIYEGETELGLQMVEGVRARYDGTRRNPWNEVECGHHYARAMASWSLITGLSGYEYSAVTGVIGFAPVIQANDFASFFSAGSGWGRFSQKQSAAALTATLALTAGTLAVQRVALQAAFKVASAKVNGQSTRIERLGTKTMLLLDNTVEIHAGEQMLIELKR